MISRARMEAHTPPPAARPPFRPLGPIAAALSLLFPGLGQLYAGRSHRAAAWVAAAATALLLPAFQLSAAESQWARVAGVLALLSGILPLRIVCAADAWHAARHPRDAVRKAYQRPPVLLALAFAYYVAGSAFGMAARELMPISFIRVSGSAMVPTLLDGDRVATRPFRSPDSLRQGMLVMYRRPDGGGFYVGRVVGLPDDYIEVIDGVLHVNGEAEALDGTALGFDVADDTLSTLREVHDPLEPFEVPDEAVFILGDNRANSRDSRHFGCVPVENLRATLEWWMLRNDLSGTPLYRLTGQDIE